MSLVDVQGVNYIPGEIALLSRDDPNPNRPILDADGELCGAVIEIPEDGNITKIGFRTYTVSVSDAIKVSLQTIDEDTGRPTGTLIDADAYGVQASVAANTTYWVSTQNPVAVTRGIKVAPVIEFNSYAGGNVRFELSYNQLGNYTLFPYVFSYIGGVWTLYANVPNFGLEYDDDTIKPIIGAIPATSYSSISWDTNNNPNRRGLRFSVPYKCRLSSIFLLCDLEADADIEIYDSDGITIIPDGTISLDANLRGSVSPYAISKNLVTPAKLEKDTFYRIAIYPITGTNIRIYYLGVTDDGAVEAMAGIDGGVNFHGTYCNGVPTAEGDWGQELKRRYVMGFGIDQLDDGRPYNVVTGATVTGQATTGEVIGE